MCTSSCCLWRRHLPEIDWTWPVLLVLVVGLAVVAVVVTR